MDQVVTVQIVQKDVKSIAAIMRTAPSPFHAAILNEHDPWEAIPLRRLHADQPPECCHIRTGPRPNGIPNIKGDAQEV